MPPDRPAHPALSSAPTEARGTSPRARLRRSRGAPAGRAWPWALHALALLVGLSCARLGLGPWLAVAALAVLLLRSLHGLTLARTVRPQVVGFQEMGYGLGSALAIGLGYALGL